ncbi:beta strand repeat-containing protein, partial [Candidatus Omnitrophota bacterium]
MTSLIQAQIDANAPSWTENGAVVYLGTGGTANTDNVGIGTTNPDAPLEIEAAAADLHIDSGGNARILFDRAATTDSAMLRYDTNAVAEWGIGIGVSSQAFGIYEDSNINQKRLTFGFDNAETVFNEDGLDIDMRFEGDNNTKLFFLDAGSDMIGIGLTNPSTALHVVGTVTASVGFSGALAGNATSATALQTARDIGGVSFDGTANIVPATITVADTNSASYVALWESDAGALAPKSDAALTYNPSSGTLTATTFSGTLSGSAAGWTDGTNVIYTTTLTDNVGIGTTNPALLNGGGEVVLDVAADGTPEIVLSRTTTDEDARASMRITATEDLRFAVQDGAASTIDAMVILSDSGYVGIGTTDPDTALEVNGDVTATTFVGALNGNASTATTASVATTLTITDNEATNETNAILFTSGGVLGGGDLDIESDGDLTYNPSSGTLTATTFVGDLTGDVTGSAAGWTDGTNVVYTTTLTDNVGIGTTNPTLLNGAGEVVLDVAADGTPEIVLSRTTAADDARASMRITATKDLRFAVKDEAASTIDAMVILSDSGYVGIGTTNPGSALEVVGAIAASTAITANGKMTANADLDVKNGATTAGVLAIFEDSDNGTNNATFTVPALAGDTDYILPPDDGDEGEQLQTDGDGTLTWESAGTETNNLEDGAAGIADTEIFIGTGAGTGNYKALGTDVTMANTGAVTISDGVEVTNWNLTTPTITTSLTTSTPTTLTAAELDRLDGLAGIITTDVTAVTDLEGTGLSITTGTLDWAAASTDLSDTADLLYETELDDESELEAQIADMGNILQETEIDGSSELLAIVTDEVGTGKLVFNTSPNFVTSVGIGTTNPGSLLDIRAVAGAAGILTLSTDELTVVDGDKLGQIDFQAPLEEGGDSVLVGASIWAEADAEFTTTNNATELVFATGASEAAAEKMRIDNAGNVGIGITNPIDPLHIVADSGGDSIHLEENTGGDDWQLGIDAEGNLNFKDSGTTAITFANGGSIGIGTTDPGTYDLYVSGDTYIGGITVTNGTLDFGGDLDMQTNDIIDVGDLGIGTANPYYALEIVGGDLAIGTTDFFVDDSTGRVGIGTTVPGSTLEVRGPTRIYGNTTVQGNKAYMFNSYNDGAGDKYLETDSAFEIWHDAPNDLLRFGAASSGAAGSSLSLNESALVLNTSGDVGIGTTNPDNVLDVVGAVSIGTLGIGNTAPANGLVVEGSVGIGMTNPNSALHVDGTITATGWSGGNITTLDSAIEEAELTLSDNVTADASTTAHGFLKKLSDDATEFMDGEGNWTIPAGTGANTALSNLASVAINASLLPETDNNIDLGSSTKTFKDAYITGDVGIGTTNPYYALEIVGGDLAIGTTDFFVNDSTGRVGIGTTVPSVALDVVGFITSTGTVEGATLTEGGIAVHNNDEMDASSELYAIVDDETGSGSGTPLLVFNVNPVLTGATLAGILADNDDMVFEADADGNGSNKFSFTDGAATEIASITEAGVLQIDSTLTIGANADVDYTITFDGDTSDGVLNYDEDNADFEFDQDIVTTGNVEGATMTEGGIAVLNNDEIDASSELSTIMDDETGTGGALVFANSPAITTPTISGDITYTGTQPKRTMVLTAAGAIVGPSSGFADQRRTDASNVSYYTVNYDGDDTAEKAFWQFVVPDSYTGTTANVTLYWATSSTTTGNVVKWFVAMQGLGDGETLNSTYAGEDSVTDNALDVVGAV